MKKAAILQKIVSHLANELELFHRAAKASFEEATDEQNKDSTVVLSSNEQLNCALCFC